MCHTYGVFLVHHFVQLLCDALHFLVLRHVYRFRAVWWRPMVVPPFMWGKWARLCVCVTLLVAVWEESTAFLSALYCYVPTSDSRANCSFESNLFKESNEPVHKIGVNDSFTNQTESVRVVLESTSNRKPRTASFSVCLIRKWAKTWRRVSW